MTRKPEETDPLPRQWLPESVVPPREDEPYWEGRVEGIMARAEPVLERTRQARKGGISWLDALGMTWRPATAAAFALAASLVLAVAFGARSRGAPDPRDVVLTTIVGDGAPAALWTGAGVQADPTLALLAIEGNRNAQGGAP